MSTFHRSHIISYYHCIITVPIIFGDIAIWRSIIAILSHSTCIWLKSLGAMALLEFHWTWISQTRMFDGWKNRFATTSPCSVVCFVIGSAVLRQYHRVTDRQTNGRTSGDSIRCNTRASYGELAKDTFTLTTFVSALFKRSKSTLAWHVVSGWQQITTAVWRTVALIGPDL